MRKKMILLSTVTALSLMFLIQNACGAVYMKQKQHTDAMKIMGAEQPARDFIVESWITPTKMVIMNNEQKSVIDLEKNIITTANHNDKTILSMQMDASENVNKEMEGMTPEEKAHFEEVMSKMMRITVTVEETNETKKIGKWNCRKYVQTVETAMGLTRSEIWATEDIKVDSELYTKHSTGMMAHIPGMSQNMDAIMKEIKKIKGVHVYTEQSTEMMGQSIRSSVMLIEFREDKPPAGVFELPTGYQKVEAFK